MKSNHLRGGGGGGTFFPYFFIAGIPEAALVGALNFGGDGFFIGLNSTALLSSGLIL